MTASEIEELVSQATTSSRGALPLTAADALRENLIRYGWSPPKQRRGAAGSKAAAAKKLEKNALSVAEPRVMAAYRLMLNNPEFHGKLTCDAAILTMVGDLADHNHQVETEALGRWWRKRLKMPDGAAGTSKPS